MDVADIIESFAADAPNSGAITVTRRTRATYADHGRAVAGTTSTLTIIARPRPASGRDLMRLPEGRRTEETRVFDTTSELLTGSQDGAFEADLVDVDGDGVMWEVQQVQKWPVAVVDQPAYSVTCQRPAAGV